MVASAPSSTAQARVVDAALELFAQHGVGGTSLQMIADSLGVTKAAVYYHFKTKDEIVVAAAESELARLDAVVAAAEGQRSRSEARDALLAGIVDLAVERRHLTSSILTDPAIVDVFAHHTTYADVMHRMRRHLVGNATGTKARVRMAMLLAAISGAAMHPMIADLDDVTLRAELLHLARRILDPDG